MALDEPRDEDHVFDDKGFSYVIEKSLFDQVKPIKVDYINTPMGAGFNISSSMPMGGGCGQSCSTC
jgi:Fe-S cluster assembly iron-binding protein IscA